MAAPAKPSAARSTHGPSATAASVAPSAADEPALDLVLASLADAPGVGPAQLPRLARLLGSDEPRVIDLLALAPRAWLDPTPCADLAAVADGAAVTVQVEIAGHEPPGYGTARPWRVLAWTAGSPIDLLWFHARGDWLERRYPVGSHHLLHGRLGRYNGRAQLPHPETVPAEAAAGERLLPIYPLVAGLTQATLRTLVARIVAALPDLPEWHAAALLARHHWPDWRAAIATLHGLGETGTAAAEQARRRLAMDELFAAQLGLALQRTARARLPGRGTAGDGALRQRLLATLPFRPTGDQHRAADEIAADMAAPRPMLRLLQGDVGSGKTLVALLAMLQAVEAGRQAALMAPTEVLATQHHRTLAKWLEPLGLAPALITAGVGKRARKLALAGLADGAIPLAIGTHALLEPDVAFNDLALAVIDEQHRFGVHQRLTLAAKGEAVDTLLMSATPIPRSLLLALYGDISASSLREKPAGRQPITTRVVPLRRIDEVVDGCARVLASGSGRIFWICPAIDEEPDGDRAAAVARHASLRQRFGASVGLVHGRMRAADRNATMAEFAHGSVRLLVATTVVEVGVDVPDASVIIIENAERFGLAQLHQLRGRVGRSGQAASCVLLYDESGGETARQRLLVLRHSDDGFAIAEADLLQRGPGELLGARQSGLPSLRFADLARDGDLLGSAREQTAAALPALTDRRHPRHASLAGLMHLFDRADTLRLLDAG